MSKHTGIAEFQAGRNDLWNWELIMEAQGNLVVPYLRQRLETLTRSTQTVRVAAAPLAPERVVGMLLFTVVVCRPGRHEREVKKLQLGDELYIITAPDAISRGLGVRWVRW